MVRTRADNCGRKAVASKAPRKVFSSGGGCGVSSSSNGDSSARAPGAPLVNHARMWPAPKWQKGISNFFSKKETNDGSSSSSSSSSSPTNERVSETSDVVVQNTPSLDIVITPDHQTSSETSNLVVEASEDEFGSSECRLQSEDDERSSPQINQTTCSKAKVGPALKNRKRRVVIADGSEEEED